MYTYEYQAYTEEGQKVTGTLEAENQPAAITAIGAKGLYPQSIRNISHPFVCTDPAGRDVDVCFINAIGNGASHLAFDCTGATTAATQHISGLSFELGMKPDSEQALRVLRELSGEAELGITDVEKRAKVLLYKHLGDDIPKLEAELVFRSLASAPKQVTVDILSPRNPPITSCGGHLNKGKLS
jgi:hypothetical protein